MCYYFPMKVRIKKLHPDAKVPKYALPGDAGMDIFCLEEVSIKPGERTQIKTGVAFEIPEGYHGFIWDKSGLSHKHGLKVLGGCYDGSYRGECTVGLINLSDEAYTFEPGHKVAQMCIKKVESPEIVVVDELNETVRGEGGFGSTGK